MEEANTLERQGDMSSRKVEVASAMKMRTFKRLVEAGVIKTLRFLRGIFRTKQDDEKGDSVSDPLILPGNDVSSKTPRVVLDADKDQKSRHAERNAKIDADAPIPEVSKPDNSNPSESSGGWHEPYDNDDTSIDDSDDEQIIRAHPFRREGRIEGEPRLDPQTNQRRPYYAEEIFALDSQGDANIVDLSLVQDKLKTPFNSHTPKTPMMSISGHEVEIIGKAPFRWQLTDPRGNSTFFRSWFLIAALPDPIPKVIIGYNTYLRRDVARHLAPVNEFGVADTSSRLCAVFVRYSGDPLTPQQAQAQAQQHQRDKDEQQRRIAEKAQRRQAQGTNNSSTTNPNNQSNQSN